MENLGMADQYSARAYVAERLRDMLDYIESGGVDVTEFSEPPGLEEISGTNPIQRRMNGVREIHLTVRPA